MQVSEVIVGLLPKLRQFLAAGIASLAAAGAANAAAIAPPAFSIIHAGHLLAIPGKAPVDKATIVVEQGKIKEIRAGYADAAALGLPADTRVIDLTGMFVMPGFIDLHVHLSGGAERGRDLNLREPTNYFTVVAYRSATAALMAGFTTVRDLGSEGYTVLGLRDCDPRRHRAGSAHPRRRATRSARRTDMPITTICARNSSTPYPAAASATAPTIAAASCGRRYAAAWTSLKSWPPAAPSMRETAVPGQQFTDEELKAIADTAHAFGRKVTAHAHAKAGIDACIRANFDSIEHGMWADEQTLKAMKAKGIWLVPTAATITYVGDTPEKVRNGPLKDLPEVSMQKVLKLGTQPRKLVTMAHKIGVGIALGTDAPLVPHGDNAMEMVTYVVDSGLTPREALMTGTVNAAQAGGIKDVGTIAPGMAADIIAMAESPLDDIHAVMNVGFVMRGGIVAKTMGDKK